LSTLGLLGQRFGQSLDQLQDFRLGYLQYLGAPQASLFGAGASCTLVRDASTPAATWLGLFSASWAQLTAALVARLSDAGDCAICFGPAPVGP
jgi:hypothetical protein